MITVELTDTEAQTVLNALEHYGGISLTATFGRCNSIMERINISSVVPLDNQSHVDELVSVNEQEISVHSDPAYLKMHGRCNSCDSKMWMLGINDGERRTSRYNSNSDACFYGRTGSGNRWVWIKSPCCASLIRRTHAKGFEDVNQYVQC